MPSESFKFVSFLPGLNKNWSTEPCQLPVTLTIFDFFVKALQILNALILASLPELQKINLEKFGKILFISFEKFIACKFGDEKLLILF